MRRMGAEGTSPKLNYNQRQLFWISAAQLYCSVSKDYYNVDSIYSDEHSPHRFRVNGVLVNSPEFAYDFNCPMGTKMNPRKKCKLYF